MRTTIQLPDDNRDALLAIAQERGDRGVSRVVEEAVSFYLAERNKPAPLVLEPPPAPGRWQRVGADLDREIGPRPGLATVLRALVRGGLRLLPL
jgi:hypothetical protein